MNARIKTAQPEPLRHQIARHLDTTDEAALKDIAKAVGKTDVPGFVVKELNAMRTDGDIECERKKGEMRYWLAKPLAAILGAAQPLPVTDAAVSLPAGINPGTRAAQVWGTLSERPRSVADISNALKQPTSTIAPVLTAMHKAGLATRIHGTDGIYRYTRPAPNAAQDGIQPQPEVGKNTGSDGPAQDPCSAEAVAVQQPAPAAAQNTAAPVAEDVTPLPARLVKSAEQCADEIDTRLEAAVEVARLTERVAELEGERDELVRQHDALRSRHDQFEHAVGAIHWTCRDAGIAAGVVHDRVTALAAELKNSRALADKLQTLLDSKRHECEALRNSVAPTSAAATEAEGALDAIRERLAPFSGDLDPPDLTEVQLAEHAASTIRRLIDTVDSIAQTEKAVDVIEAAKGFIVRAPKRRLRLISKPQRAREEAIAAACAGAKKADVYALVYIGSAERSAAWKEAS